MLLEKNSCTHHGYIFLFSKHCLPRVVEYDIAYHTKICFHKKLYRFKYECFFEKKLYWHKENRQVWIYLKQNDYSANINLYIELPIIFV